MPDYPRRALARLDSGRCRPRQGPGLAWRGGRQDSAALTRESGWGASRGPFLRPARAASAIQRRTAGR